MEFLEVFRKRAFWGLDFLKGSPVRKHYNEVKFIMENFNSNKANTLRSNHLKNILKHAKETTKFRD